MQFLLHDYPDFGGLLSKTDLQALVENGTVDPRSSCTDVRSRQVLAVAEALGMQLPKAGAAARGQFFGGRRPPPKPSYQEFGPDQDPHWPSPRPQPGSAAARPVDLIETGQEHWRGRVGSSDLADDQPDDQGDGDDSSMWLYFGRPSWFRQWRLLLLSALCLLGAGWLSEREEGYALICLLTSGSLLLWAMMRRQNHEYIVTSERIEHGWGIFGRSSREVLIRDIRTLDVKQGGLFGLLGFGTLEVTSVAQAGVELRFELIWRPHRVKELIRELQRRPENGWAQAMLGQFGL